MAALAFVEAKEKLAVAEARKEWLDKHVRGHQSAALHLALLEAQLELTRGKHESERRFAKAEADLRTAEAVQAAEQAKFKRLEKQVAGCQVRAPRGGIVVYPITTTNRGVRSPLLEVGAEVRQRQPILRVVDMKNLQLRVKVHESRINRVRVGQSAVIRFDAVLNRSFSGRVTHVNPTPEPTTWLDGNIKRYAVLVSIDDVPETLRLGMTAVAEIDVSGQGVSSPEVGSKYGLLPPLTRFDNDGDGKVSKSELPDPLKRLFDQLDSNEDGVIDEGEWKELRTRAGAFGRRPEN
jgi:biotin carboxyl carrier protein